MAVQGSVLTEPFVLELEGISYVEPLPITALITPWEAPAPDGIVGPHITNRFPTPPSARGFLTDVEIELVNDNLRPPYHIASALSPESTYLEPTIGQIWPR